MTRQPYRYLLLLALWAGAPAAAQCTGDCDGSTEVKIDELVTSVRIASNAAPLSQCVAIDSNGNEAVVIGELLAAVDHALEGCPPGPATPTPVATVTPTPGGATVPVGTWSGTGIDATTGVPRQLRIRVDAADAGAWLVTDLGGNLFNGRSITVLPLSPNIWSYSLTTSTYAETLNMSVLPTGDLTGTYATTTLTFPPVASSTPFTLSRES